ncbi:MAG: hypothetical protein GY884_09280, partial [Proteobacteria bacterium]|nr:hypothetical protein [Pseudomonadota bacterium]
MALLLACNDRAGSTDSADEATFVPMEADEWLVRLSLDLRHRRPAPEELAAVRDDPSLVDGYLDAWLDSADFADVVQDLFAEIYRTRTEDYYTAEDVGL